MAQSHFSNLNKLETRTSRLMPQSTDCITKPCQSVVNVAWDSQGVPDSNPNVWGNAGFVLVNIPFVNVPVGYRVRIIRMFGDYIAWIHGIVQPATHTGILFGFMRTQDLREKTGLGSLNMSYGSDQCFMYHQGALSTGDFTQYFDHDVSAGGLLQPDNTMLLQIAVFENETGSSVHQEVTSNVVYQFEPNKIN
jgi:hypothetical protein